MTNKFKAIKGGKAINLNDNEKELTLEELETALAKMTEDRFKKMDITYDMIDTKLDSLCKRYHGMAGVIDVVDAYKRLDDSAMIFDALDVAMEMQGRMEAIKMEWGTMLMACKLDFEGHKEELNGWLDQFLDPNFVDNIGDVRGFYEDTMQAAVKELLVMSACQELWELIRRLVEFWDESGKQIDDVVCKIKELKSEE